MNLTIDRLPGESRPARRPLSRQDEKSVEYGFEEAEEWRGKRGEQFACTNATRSNAVFELVHDIEYRFPVTLLCQDPRSLMFR